MTYSTRCHSRSPLLANWLLVLASVAFHGCGGQRVEYVDGVVTLDGKPVSRAIVQFIPRGEGRHAGGQTDAGGMYRLNTMGGTSGAGAKAGDYYVAIDAYEDPFAGMPERPADAAEVEKWDQKMAQLGMKPAKRLSPKEYADQQTSGLSATVKPGRNKIDFELKSDFKGITPK